MDPTWCNSSMVFPFCCAAVGCCLRAFRGYAAEDCVYFTFVFTVESTLSGRPTPLGLFRGRVTNEETLPFFFEIVFIMDKVASQSTSGGASTNCRAHTHEGDHG